MDLQARNGHSKNRLDVVIVGGGLVGSLEALFLAKRGHRVRLYEYREDVQKTSQAHGRSINLALSVRGRKALQQVGVEKHMTKEHLIPMKSRFIHGLDGSTYEIPYDPTTNQAIDSVDRSYLNGLLLKEADNYTNIEKHFNHKLVDANLQKGNLTFYKTDTQETIEVNADLVIGADGAFSAVRKSMMKQPLFDYRQEYIEHGYLELCIPPGENGDFQMTPNCLHLWPRGSFIMLALPNQDCSWRVTLLLPFEKFKDFDSNEKLFEFFNKYFHDFLTIVGKERLAEDFFKGSPHPLVHIKCRPYHVSDKAVLIGDAAHAMLPFYGQGMNAGFEDCVILDNLLLKHNNNLKKVLEEFSDTRWVDTYAMTDLALYNYIEIRDLVTRPGYRLRKAVDDYLFWLLPTIWVPLYNSVSFTTMPYSACVKNREWQDKMLKTIFNIIFFLILVGFFIRYFTYISK